MATSTNDRDHRELFALYCVWAQICSDKHGLPWPLSRDEAQDAADDILMKEIKKLKELGRTPHEG